jgi:hypothetical protein
MFFNLPLFSVGVLFFVCVASLREIIYFGHFDGSCGFLKLFKVKTMLGCPPFPLKSV